MDLKVIFKVLSTKLNIACWKNVFDAMWRELNFCVQAMYENMNIFASPPQSFSKNSIKCTKCCQLVAMLLAEL